VGSVSSGLINASIGCEISRVEEIKNVAFRELLIHLRERGDQLERFKQAMAGGKGW
jgi:hypothetical protein